MALPVLETIGPGALSAPPSLIDNSGDMDKDVRYHLLELLQKGELGKRLLKRGAIFLLKIVGIFYILQTPEI